MIIMLLVVAICGVIGYVLYDTYSARTTTPMLFGMVVNLYSCVNYTNPILTALYCLCTFACFFFIGMLLDEPYYKHIVVPHEKVLSSKARSPLDRAICRIVHLQKYEFNYNVYVLLQSLVPMVFVYMLFCVLTTSSEHAYKVGMGVFVIAIVRCFYILGGVRCDAKMASALYHAAIGGLLSIAL